MKIEFIVVTSNRFNLREAFFTALRIPVIDDIAFLYDIIDNKFRKKTVKKNINNNFYSFNFINIHKYIYFYT